MEAEPEIWPDEPPSQGIDAELAYARAELEELRSVFSEGEPTDEARELGLAKSAEVEAQIRDLEALARDDARPDAVVESRASIESSHEPGTPARRFSQ